MRAPRCGRRSPSQSGDGRRAAGGGRRAPGGGRRAPGGGRREAPGGGRPASCPPRDGDQPTLDPLRPLPHRYRISVPRSPRRTCSTRSASKPVPDVEQLPCRLRCGAGVPREAASDRLDRREVPVRRYRTSNNPATGAAPRSSSTGRTSKAVPGVEQLPAGGDAPRTARRPAHLSGGRGAVKRGGEEAQASSVSSRRLRVRFTSTGMPGPMVVDTVIFVM
ncbi:hypothetical protein DS079_07800 [Brachybacterium paraconglomeratum]|uniref:Uncharacterized protein n=1 Tax=Brachybacterium paraconglomeratum TaxID=173362 RepID=A0A426SLE2_9MICO|nr:hypothetical protein DS079_07800 [Brachybacterium paraconglomeratum]